jgi:hypothetical protein
LFLLFFIFFLQTSSLAKEKYTPPLFPTSPIKIVITGRNITQNDYLAFLLDEIKRQSQIPLNDSLQIDPEKDFLLDSPPLPQNWKKVYLPLIVKNEEKNIEQITVCALVFNEVIPPKEDDYLIISNNPEKITDIGRLLTFSLEKGKSTRLIYHHKNENKKNIFIALTIKNKSQDFINLHLINSLCGPNKDGIFAGHQATKLFLEFSNNNIGEILSIPPQQTKIISLQEIKPNEVVSGLMKIHLLYGNNALFRLIAFDKESSEIALMLDTEKENLSGRSGSIFQDPVRDKYYSIEINSNNRETLTIGDQPYLVDAFKGTELKGNFGLLYRFHLVLKNTSENNFATSLYFSSIGGVARSNFLIENELFETGLLSPKNELQKTLDLKVPPKSMIKFSLITIPQAGSNYPISITLKNEALRTENRQERAER